MNAFEIYRKLNGTIADGLYGCGNANGGALGVLGNANIINTNFLRVNSAPNDTAHNWVQLTAGRSHTLVINSNGELYVCGSNNYGLLGLGTQGHTCFALTRSGTASNWVQTTGGNSFSLALNSNGELYGCGWNAYGQLGLTDPSNHVNWTRVGTASNWMQIASGALHSLAINKNGELYSCGDNDYGQLGLGDSGKDTQRYTLTRVGTASNWKQVAGASFYSMAINSNGELYVCGSWIGDSSTTLTRIGTASNWVKVAGGSNHTLALNSNGELYGCGYNSNGQLGLGDTYNTPTFTRIGTASNWTQIAAGYYSSLAINSDGELYSCGRNEQGNLGLGDTVDRRVLTRVGTAKNWTQIAAGELHSLAIRKR